MQDDHKPSISRSARPGATQHPSASSTSSSNGTDSPSTLPPSRKPGDDAAAGTVGTGEDICTRCEGTGKLAGGSDCPDCEGSGVVIQGIGGG